MKIRTYTNLLAIQKEDDKRNIELFETKVAFSFRVFENKQTTFLHIYYKDKTNAQ